MKLGLLGFSGDSAKSRTDNLGIYRPESNRHIQDFNGKARFYQYYAQHSLPIWNAYSSMCFSTDGEYVFIGNTSLTQGRVYRFTLSTPWDITSINNSTYQYQDLSDRVSYVTGGSWPGRYITGISFSPNGQYMFVTFRDRPILVRFTLSGYWSLASAPTIGLNAPVSQENTDQIWYLSATDGIAGNGTAVPEDVHISPDGLHVTLLFSGSSYDSIAYNITLKNAFDLGRNTNTPVSPVQSGRLAASDGDPYSLSLESYDNNMKGLTLSNSGKQLYVCGLENSRVYAFSLPSAHSWDDTNTPSYTYDDFLYEGSLLGGEGDPQSLFMNKIGDLFIYGENNTIYQYKLIQK